MDTRYWHGVAALVGVCGGDSRTGRSRYGQHHRHMGRAYDRPLRLGLRRLVHLRYHHACRDQFERRPERSHDGSIGYNPTTGPNGTDDMEWLSLNHQLANGDSSHVFTWHDSTKGGTFATVFLNGDYFTFATNYDGNIGDGWSPASSINVGLRYYGYPTSVNNPRNAYALIFVPDNLATTNAISLAWNESTDTGSLGLAYTAYADYTTNGMMGSVGMTGTSASAYGKKGSMDGVPLSEVITVITPPNLLVGLSNGVLQLTWPTNYTGAWRLQALTNAAAAGLGTNWVEVQSSSGVTQISVPVDPANQAVFFRLVYP